jgi:hypothetical protein
MLEYNTVMLNYYFQQQKRFINSLMGKNNEMSSNQLRVAFLKT